MDKALLLQWKELSFEKVTDKMFRRIFVGQNFQVISVEGKEGASIPIHSHDNAEQITVMLEGTLMMVAGGVEHILTTDTVFIIPRKIPHSGKILKDCRYVDFFTAPVQLFKGIPP